jgi:hypothetical protein
MFKSTFVRVCIAVTIAIGIVVPLSADHSWGDYHWARTSNPFTLKVGNNVSAVWEQFLDAAISDWSVSTVLDLTKVAGTSTRNCKPKAGRIEVCNAAYGNNGWLGIAQIWITGGVHITQAVTKVNDFYFNTATYNTPDWRQFVMCQEVGHDFGLDHQDENFDNPNLGSCMDYTGDPGGVTDPVNNLHPNSHDYQQLVSMYTHLDKTTTVGASSLPSAMPPAMGQLDFDTPGRWGRLVSSSRNGRSETFELDFGSGNKVVTHVFWANPEADAR